MAKADPKKSGYLGVDLGTSGIKLVEVVAQGKSAHLTTYGIVEEDMALLEMDAKRVQEVGKLLSSLLQGTHAKSRRALSALPNFAVFSSVLSLPPLSKRELERSVRWETKKLLPTPIEDMVLDWKVLEGIAPSSAARSKSSSLKVLVTAAPRTLIATVMGIFKAAGVELLSLETESFSVIRSLVGHEQTGAMIVDLGAGSTEVTATAFGVPIVTRSVKFSGEALSRAVSESLGIPRTHAEQFKRDLAVGGTSFMALPPFAAPSETLFNEIKFVGESFRREMEEFGADAKIEKIVLTGGQAYLPGLGAELERAFGARTFIGNPFSHTIYPKELEGTLEDAGPRFVVAVGAALKNIV